MENHNGQQINTLIQKDFFVSVSEKSDKLVTALYMVTDCMSDAEPMKDTLRRQGLQFLTAAKALEHSSAIERGIGAAHSEGLISEIVSLVTISETVGLVSHMNGQILKKEFQILREALAKEKLRTFGVQSDRQRLSGLTLREDMFGEKLEFRAEDSQGHVLYKGQREIMSFIKPKQTEYTAKESQTKKLDIALKINRRNSILKLIKDKKSVMIKDITSVISDCSEKTIQRELLALVAQGVLKREGEKRWSRYSLR